MNGCGYYLGNFWKHFGNFFPTSGHTADSTRTNTHPHTFSLEPSFTFITFVVVQTNKRIFFESWCLSLVSLHSLSQSPFVSLLFSVNITFSYPPLEQISRAPFSILDSPSRIDGKFLKEKQLSNPFFKKVLVKNLYLSALALISRLTGGILR